MLADLVRELAKVDNESGLEQTLKYNNLSEALAQIQRIDTLQEKLNEVVFATKILKQNLETKKETLKNLFYG